MLGKKIHTEVIPVRGIMIGKKVYTKPGTAQSNMVSHMMHRYLQLREKIEPGWWSNNSSKWYARKDAYRKRANRRVRPWINKKLGIHPSLVGLYDE